MVEKVGDIKTRIQAMKCLTTFCEAVGPKFVFDRVREAKFLHLRMLFAYLASFLSSQYREEYTSKESIEHDEPIFDNQDLVMFGSFSRL